MVEYTPPPANLEGLNPIQRYMQKGHLDRQDYIYLAIFVLAYIALRPAIKKGAAWFLAPPGYSEGEQARQAYAESKAKVGANTIRGTKEDNVQIPEGDMTGAKASGSNLENKGQVSNRKGKGSGTEKSEVDKLLDWDDEPAGDHKEGEKADVVTWLEKWDK